MTNYFNCLILLLISTSISCNNIENQTIETIDYNSVIFKINGYHYKGNVELSVIEKDLVVTVSDIQNGNLIKAFNVQLYTNVLSQFDYNQTSFNNSDVLFYDEGITIKNKNDIIHFYLYNSDSFIRKFKEIINNIGSDFTYAYCSYGISSYNGNYTKIGKNYQRINEVGFIPFFREIHHKESSSARTQDECVTGGSGHRSCTASINTGFGESISHSITCATGLYACCTYDYAICINNNVGSGGIPIEEGCSSVHNLCFAPE
ncbi:hypothetical protein EI427_25535 (plasmid) [Flammeovirga pectinis]|uniref:Uncharacterized protein n=1 Tax=Flammeovirga pectinis TaxID=2494373 RepID=A0A3S9PBJ5_9BACT|nr:hypothetical protein [Flammeovirga pectinis]AZQ65601.1 hypothetical protein EI427_25535 [Flammeovirga pectinis]